MTVLFNPSDVREGDFILHAVTASGVAYARALSEGIEGQVFVGQNVVERFSLKPGDAFKGRVVPNYHDRRETVPWRLIYLSESPNQPKPREEEPRAKDRGPTPEEVAAMVAEYSQDGRVWTSRDLFYEIFDTDIDENLEDHRKKLSLILDRLAELCKEGVLFRLKLYKTEEFHVNYYCSDIDALTPEGYK